MVTPLPLGRILKARENAMYDGSDSDGSAREEEEGDAADDADFLGHKRSAYTPAPMSKFKPRTATINGIKMQVTAEEHALLQRPSLLPEDDPVRQRDKLSGLLQHLDPGSEQYKMVLTEMRVNDIKLRAAKKAERRLSPVRSSAYEKSKADAAGSAFLMSLANSIASQQSGLQAFARHSKPLRRPEDKPSHQRLASAKGKGYAGDVRPTARPGPAFEPVDGRPFVAATAKPVTPPQHADSKRINTMEVL